MITQRTFQARSAESPTTGVHAVPKMGLGSFSVLDTLSCYLSFIVKHYDTKFI